VRRLAALWLAVALVTPALAAASDQHPSQNELESEIMCPICGTTLDQSDSAAAQQLKMFIRSRIAAGQTKGQIEDQLVARFGEQVLAAPPKKGFNLLAWLLPLVGLAIAVPVVGYAAWRWSHSRDRADEEPPPGPLDPELERRLERELARFEGQ
jgi:cytochrome c-type biogenesis protein CcmH